MKKLFIVLAVLSLFASMVMASETRLNGLGLDVNSFDGPDAWMVSDATNVKLFPATIVKYSKLAVFEYDGRDLNSYLNIDLLGGVIGLYTNNNTYSYVIDNTKDSGVLYGRNLSDTMSVALGITYQQYLDKQVQNSTEVPVSNNKDIHVNNFINSLGINLGLGLLGDIPLDFGLSLLVPLSISNEITLFNTDGDKIKYYQNKNSGFEAKLSAKATLGDIAIGLGVQSYSKSHSYIEQTFTSGEVLSYDWNVKDAFQNTLLQLGAVKTVKLDKTTVFAGAQFEFNFYNYYWETGFDKVVQTKTDSTQYEDGLWINVPLIIGAETKLNDNWTLRAGAKKAMWENNTYKEYTKNADGKITSAGNTYTSSNTNNINVNFGATFTVATFSIDFLVNKNLILNGPEFISGRGAYGDNATPWASKIALNFKW